MIPGFAETRLRCGDVTLSVHRAGAGVPLLLLHGFPQNHRCWAQVAPGFAAAGFDVIVPDLRGYGASDAPPDDPSHAAYSKRTMAGDLVALLSALGLPAAHVLGHDRGARVAYRLALDHPDRVLRLGILEIVPTADFWAAWSAELGLAAWHWAFLAQPAPLPETLIGGNPRGFVDALLAAWSGTKDLSPFAPEALESYRAQIADPARLHAMCADYRAGAGPDRAADLDDRRAGRRIAAPLCCLWGRDGFPARSGRPLEIWRGWAADVCGEPVGSGHFLPEEAPGAVLRALLAHFSASGH